MVKNRQKAISAFARGRMHLTLYCGDGRIAAEGGVKISRAPASSGKTGPPAPQRKLVGGGGAISAARWVQHVDEALGPGSEWKPAVRRWLRAAAESGQSEAAGWPEVTPQVGSRK